MSTMLRNCVLVAIATLVTALSLANNASAQPLPEHGGRVFGLVGGSFGEGGSASLTAGGAGLRLNRNLGLDVEVLHAHDLDFSDDNFFIRDRQRLLLVPPFEFIHDSAVTAFTTRLTVEFPVAGDRLIPFVSGGGGVGRIAERVGFRCSGVCPVILQEPVIVGFPPFAFPFPEIDLAETGLALTLGGGVDVVLWKGLAVGGEVRWFRLLLNQRDLDVAHVSGRVSYRF